MSTNTIRSSFQHPSKFLRSRSLPNLQDLRSVQVYFPQVGQDNPVTVKPHFSWEVLGKTPCSRSRMSTQNNEIYTGYDSEEYEEEPAYQSQKKTPAEEVFEILGPKTLDEVLPAEKSFVSEPNINASGLGKVQSALKSAGNFFKKMWSFFNPTFLSKQILHTDNGRKKVTLLQLFVNSIHVY